MVIMGKHPDQLFPVQLPVQMVLLGHVSWGAALAPGSWWLRAAADSWWLLWETALAV